MKLKQFENLAGLEAEVKAYNIVTQKKINKDKKVSKDKACKKELEQNNSLPYADKFSKTKDLFKDHTAYKKLVNDLDYPGIKK